MLEVTLLARLLGLSEAYILFTDRAEHFEQVMMSLVCKIHSIAI